MLHLPALVITRQIEKVFRSLQKISLAVRGLFGEGSQAMGDFYQISNQITLGRSEDELVQQVNDIVPVIIDYERQARQFLIKESQENLHDRVSRAYGILRTAQTISSEETMHLLSSVRMGVNLGLIPDLQIADINELFIHTQPAHLQKRTGGELGSADRNIERARYLRQYLNREDGAQRAREELNSTVSASPRQLSPAPPAPRSAAGTAPVPLPLASPAICLMSELETWANSPSAIMKSVSMSGARRRLAIIMVNSAAMSVIGRTPRTITRAPACRTKSTARPWKVRISMFRRWEVASRINSTAHRREHLLLVATSSGPGTCGNISTAKMGRKRPRKIKSPRAMRLFFIGDIVGKPGRQICTQALRGLRQEQAIDLIVANGENAAGGSGLTPPIYHELLAAGIDGITLGDHVYKRSEVIPILQTEPRIVRPANYPAEAPGPEVMILTVANQVRVAVFCS